MRRGRGRKVKDLGMSLADREAIARGRRIAKAREDKHWTQERLGEEAGGYGRAAINRLEHASRSKPSAALVYGVARALGMTFEEIWTGIKERPREDEQAVRDAIRTIEQRLPGALREVSAEPTPPAVGEGPSGKPPSKRSRPSS